MNTDYIPEKKTINLITIYNLEVYTNANAMSDLIPHVFLLSNGVEFSQQLNCDVTLHPYMRLYDYAQSMSFFMNIIVTYSQLLNIQCTSKEAQKGNCLVRRFFFVRTCCTGKLYQLNFYGIFHGRRGGRGTPHPSK